MTSWFRRADAGSEGWFETEQDGIVVRQASFSGPQGPASVAASRDELAWTRAEFDSLGARLYEVRYGVPMNGTVTAGEPVSEAEFETAWQAGPSQPQHDGAGTAPVHSPGALA